MTPEEIAAAVAEELCPTPRSWSAALYAEITRDSHLDKLLALGVIKPMDEHVKTWTAEKVAQELNPPEDLYTVHVNVERGFDFGFRPDRVVVT